MLNKIFLGLLAVATLGMLVLTYLQYSWLQSVTNPKDVVAQYDFYNNLFWSFLWISSLALLIFGNVILWKLRKSWAMWTSLSYFAVFVLIQMWWLRDMYVNYQKQNGLSQGEFSLGIFLAVLLCVVGAVIVFFDQSLVLRMSDRIQGNPQIGIETKNEMNLPEIEN